MNAEVERLLEEVARAFAAAVERGSFGAADPLVLLAVALAEYEKPAT